jgi:hypothetical protein
LRSTLKALAVAVIIASTIQPDSINGDEEMPSDTIRNATEQASDTLNKAAETGADAMKAAGEYADKGLDHVG